MTGVPPGYFTILDFMTMTELERNMALSQYKNMVQGGARIVMDPNEAIADVKKKAKRKKSAYSRALSKELKAVRAKATTKSGKLRKGMTPAKILKKAHRQVKRRMK